MPTPVSTARQCLTDEAAHVLDDAVSVARRRSHSQTTSLHTVSALLSLQTSILRDACAHARSLAYSSRLQFRALDLCVSVSLDRLSVSKAKTLDAEPPVSNSLMAAIKRSQANQRRHPETFHLYQMHQQLYNSQSSLSTIKVELKHFVLSILDDPIVSRVFGDAGFRSSDIKIAILHPPSKLLLHKSITLNRPDSGGINRSGINFPFAVDNGEEDYNRIGSVLTKNGSRNPLLIGVYADTVVSGFICSIKIGKVKFLPTEIDGLDVVEIDKEIRELGSGELSEDGMDLKLKEVREKVEGCRGCGVIVSFGDLKVFLDGGSMEFVVEEVSKLVKIFGGKLWLIGFVGSYDVYMKILKKFPRLEKDWNLNLLPVTCSNLNAKSSLMGSFVPFDGFFPAQTEFETASRNSEQSMACCDICKNKCEQEVSVVKGGRTVSIADQQSMGLASWLRVPECDSTKGNNAVEAEDQGGVLTARVMGVRRKWSDICHRLHHNPPPQQNTSHVWARSPLPHHFQPDRKRGESSGKDSNQGTQYRNLSPPVDYFTSTSSSTNSITTNLGLATIYVAPDPGPKPPAHETFHGSPTGDVDETSKHVMTEKDFKQLYRALAAKVGYQKDPIWAISQTVTRFRTGNQKHHVWFLFSGPDPVGKRKICTILAEVVFGSPESLISIDLNIENQIPHPGCIFNQKNAKFSDPCFRGKTVTEFIAEELFKKPQSVVLLEHIDKADFLTKDNFSQAIKSGKLTDARGRETRISDAIFVFTTSNSEEENVKDFISYSEERIMNAKAMQMRLSIEKAQPESSGILLWPKDSTFRHSELSKKRKIIEIEKYEIVVPKAKKPQSCFDLNLPLDEPEQSDNEALSEAKESWLEEFSDQVDDKVVFEPFDFDTRAETILKDICKRFQNSFGSRVVLEIEDAVMVQILASCWLSDGNGGVDNWIETVLCRGLMEVEKKHCVDGEAIVRLGTIEGVKIEENGALCVCLPSRIMVE